MGRSVPQPAPHPPLDHRLQPGLRPRRLGLLAAHPEPGRPSRRRRGLQRAFERRHKGSRVRSRRELRHRRAAERVGEPHLHGAGLGRRGRGAERQRSALRPDASERGDAEDRPSLQAVCAYRDIGHHLGPGLGACGCALHRVDEPRQSSD